MKYILPIVLTSFACGAHVHDDWTTIHQVHPDTHEIVHLASSHSNNRDAMLTIQCDRRLTLYELGTNLKGVRIENVEYSLDYGEYVDVKSYTEMLGYRSVFVHTITERSYSQIIARDILSFKVTSVEGETEIYTFSLNGVDEAYHTLMDLCE
ncbi:hypothetical protein VPHK567_0196 [Vibrio phage K567]|nr:hypothetical protein MYOV011v1_p0018 [Vibrio phage 6E35.1a]